MSVWRHKKSQRLYLAILSKGIVACSGDSLRDGDEVTIYRDPDTMQYFVRRTTEFNDGRFEMTLLNPPRPK